VLVKNKYKLREEEKNTRRKGGVPSERERERIHRDSKCMMVACAFKTK
jgi:hypothetical protein